MDVLEAAIFQAFRSAFFKYKSWLGVSRKLRKSPAVNRIVLDNQASDDLVPLPVEEDFVNVCNVSRGAYGTVDLVRRKDSPLLFAAKKIDKQSLEEDFEVDRVFQERDILMRVTGHATVVAFDCSYITDHHLCLVMQFAAGGDFSTLLAKGALPLDVARFYAAQLVLAIEYLHSKNVIHCDLKPDNLLLDANGHLKVADFGAGRMTNACGQFSNRRVRGTPDYLAPELVTSCVDPDVQPRYSKAVDWYAAGVVIYQLVIGCPPFFGEDLDDLYRSVLNDRIEWPDDHDFAVPAEVKHLVQSLMERDPDRRLATHYGAAELKVHPFFSAVQWDNIYQQRPPVVPQLKSGTDTSRFDPRADRYGRNPIQDRNPELDQRPIFVTFPSLSPKNKPLAGFKFKSHSSCPKPTTKRRFRPKLVRTKSRLHRLRKVSSCRKDRVLERRRHLSLYRRIDADVQKDQSAEPFPFGVRFDSRNRGHRNHLPIAGQIPSIPPKFRIPPSSSSLPLTSLASTSIVRRFQRFPNIFMRF